MTTTSSTTGTTGSLTRLTGLSSGLDIDSWVKDLMKVEQTKVDTQAKKKQTMQWQQDAYRAINTKLLALRTSAFDMKLQSTFQTKSADSTDTSVLTATAGTSAVSGSYTIKVNSMAAAVTKSSTAALGSNSDKTSLAAQFGLSGNVSFTLEGKGGSKDFTFDTTTTTIGQLAATINQANLGIKATYDSGTDRFYLSSTTTGSAAEIHVKADAENFLTNTLKLNVNVGTDETNAYKGTDANIDFNDATGLTFSSNNFTLNGINVNLKKNSGSATVTVSEDVDAQMTKIKSFVEAYNNAVDALGTEISASHDKDYTPLTDAQKAEMSETQIDKWEAKAKTGLLQSDSLLASTYNSLRSMAYTQVKDNTGSYSSLSSIGITTSSVYTDKGKLYIDETKLRAALTADPEAVMNLFTETPATGTASTSSNTGLAVQLYNNVNAGITNISNKAGSSSNLVDNSVLGKQISELTSRISDMEDQMKTTEDRYYTKFTAMETALQKFNSQSLWLSNMFSSTSSSS